MRPTFLGTPTRRLDPVTAASEFRHVAASGQGRFQRDPSGNADIQGVRIDKQKADLLETALKTRGIADQKAFSERLRRHGAGLEDEERDLLINLAANWFETTADQEFEVIAANSLELLGNRASGNIASTPVKRDTSDAPEQPASLDSGRLQAELETASRNRRAAIERAARKEAEFNVARDASNIAWERVQKESAKAGIQVGYILLTGKGRAAPPALAAAIGAYNQAMTDAARQQDELNVLRNDIAEWDNVIHEILARMPGAPPAK